MAVSTTLDHERLVQALRGLSIQAPTDRIREPAVRVVDCVLSLNRDYDVFVVPRIDAFERNCPHVRSVSDLKAEMVRYPSPHAFVLDALKYNHEARAITLGAVVNWLVTISGDGPAKTQLANLQAWARKAHYSDHLALHIHGFAIAGFQYLRMLFGANTTKPDVYICRFVEEHLGHAVTPLQAVELLEHAAIEADVSLRDADASIWESAARKPAMAARLDIEPVPKGSTSPTTMVSLTGDGEGIFAMIAGFSGRGETVPGALRDLADELVRNGVVIDVTEQVHSSSQADPQAG